MQITKHTILSRNCNSHLQETTSLDFSGVFNSLAKHSKSNFWMTKKDNVANKVAVWLNGWSKRLLARPFRHTKLNKDQIENPTVAMSFFLYSYFCNFIFENKWDCLPSFSPAKSKFWLSALGLQAFDVSWFPASAPKLSSFSLMLNVTNTGIPMLSLVRHLSLCAGLKCEIAPQIWHGSDHKHRQYQTFTSQDQNMCPTHSLHPWQRGYWTYSLQEWGDKHKKRHTYTSKYSINKKPLTFISETVAGRVITHGTFQLQLFHLFWHNLTVERSFSTTRPRWLTKRNKS